MNLALLAPASWDATPGVLSKSTSHSTRSFARHALGWSGLALGLIANANAANVSPHWQQNLEPCATPGSSRVVGLAAADALLVVNGYCQGSGQTKTWRLDASGATVWSRTLCASCTEIPSDPSAQMVAPAIVAANGDVVSVYRSDVFNLRLARVTAGRSLRHDVAIGEHEGPAPGLHPVPGGTVIVSTSNALLHVGGTGAVVGQESLFFDPITAPYYFSFHDLTVGADGRIWRALRHAPGSIDFGQHRDFEWRPLNNNMSYADGFQRLVPRAESTLVRLLGDGTLVMFDFWVTPGRNFRLSFYNEQQALVQTRDHLLSAVSPVMTARNADDQMAVVTSNGFLGPYAVSRFSSTGDLLNTTALSFLPTQLVLANSGEMAVLERTSNSAQVMVLNTAGEPIMRWSCTHFNDCEQFPEFVANMQDAWMVGGTDLTTGTSRAWVARLQSDVGLFQSGFESP